MNFNSLAFLAFFPVVCIIYFCIPSLKWRNYFLLAASYYFYMNWEPVYALLLLTSTAITYGAAIGISSVDEKRKKKAFLVTSIVLNLLILFFFKYYAFAADSITTCMASLGLSIHIPEFKVLLPVGISFYTFQALGYSIYVYRGDVKVERNFLTYALFVSFFPQLVAGPIERSTRLLPQFYKKHAFDSEQAWQGLKLMIWGYFLKLVVADRLGLIIDLFYDGDFDNIKGTLFPVLTFPFQLYGDFAGYTFIAIGCARIMGFTLMDNFHRPYIWSTSIQDFWKRNHISLTSWFMDYVYYPLTEHKNTLNWWCFCIFITFVISGLWHGASWTFVVWGALHGVLLSTEMLIGKRRKKWEKKHNLKDNTLYLWIERIAVFLFCAVTLIFFRANTFTDAGEIISRLFKPIQWDVLLGNSTRTTISVIVGLIILIVKKGLEEYHKTVPGYANRPVLWDTIWLVFLLMVIAQFGVFGGGQFIYFQF